VTFHQPLAVVQKAKTNNYFRRAVDTQEYRDAVALLETALQHRSSLPAVNLPPQQPDRPAGLDDWLTAVATAKAAEQDREIRFNALTSLISICHNQIAAVVDVMPDRVLHALATDMAELMSQVDDAVGRLGGARTANEVIAAGVGDIWNELRQLRKSYDQLRDAQAFVMADEMSRHASTYLYDDPHASRLFIRNIDDVFPAWRDPGPSTITLSGAPPDPRPWPTDPIAQLVWLSSSDAQVWLPTFGQLEQLQAELHRKRNPAPEVVPGRPDKPTQQFGTHRRRTSVL
jgi:hypothetical protein